ncbi:MAG: cyclodeaminase/cyclohydrolase family protein [Lachnospiraceae bacterium]|nr:cyclodeaminase/cyclohydrolase family protein [Lachnospiraceae bacterium]
MKDFTQDSCREFVRALASSDPVPGGGGAAALAGALGTALGNMVGSLTVGKKKYAAVEEEILSLKAECDALEEELLDQVLLDAEGFAPLAEAYRIPKGQEGREEILEQATLAACEVPLRIMRLACRALDAVRTMAEKGSRLAVSDAGCGAALLRASLEAAALNVYINTKTLKDRDAAERINAECGGMLMEYRAAADEIYAAVLDSLR